jgi:hypothetical protein
VPLLGRDDDLEHALEQDGREQRERERLAEDVGDVLDEEVEHHDVDEDIDDGSRDARVDRSRSVLGAVGHAMNVADVARGRDLSGPSAAVRPHHQGVNHPSLGHLSAGRHARAAATHHGHLLREGVAMTV